MGGSPPSRQTHLAIEALIPIWEKVLDRSPISAADNFFELGGDHDLAVALSRAIEESTGQRLPVTTIYNAPTVAGLAKELEGVSPRFSPLVLLKRGDNEPSLFIAAGAGGSIVYFSRLAKGFSPNHSVYAIEARGLDGVRAPHGRVEDMAEDCLNSVLGRQPHGPYLLAGHSLGGLVMLEVAQRLVNRGEEIALLALIDTYPHPRYWPLSLWIISAILNFSGSISKATRLRRNEVLPFLRKRCENFVDHALMRSRLIASHRSDAALAELPGQLKSVSESSRAAWSCYRPCYYPGRITFMRAEVPRGGGIWPTDPVKIWGALAGSLDLQTVRGNHRTILATHTGALSAQLSLAVERALKATVSKSEAGAMPRGEK
jgi:acetoacetyl-CoA synthetase